jgi:hypothetical protein
MSSKCHLINQLTGAQEGSAVLGTGCCTGHLQLFQAYRRRHADSRPTDLADPASPCVNRFSTRRTKGARPLRPQYARTARGALASDHARRAVRDLAGAAARRRRRAVARDRRRVRRRGDPGGGRVNAEVGCITESHAERTIASLRKLGHPAVQVLRDGRRRDIPADRVVPGDLLVLTAGSVFAADARVLAGRELLIDQSVLTGREPPDPQDVRTARPRGRTAGRTRQHGVFEAPP